MDRYPHQLSGGMLQRVVIAMALAAEPSLLILDEPTTALDATVEAEVLDLISALRAEFGTSVLFISHNLGVIAKMCDRVGVLYAGELVEEGPARQVFDDPRHPYTVGLLRCIPRRGTLKGREQAGHDPRLPARARAQIAEGCIFADRCGLAEDRCRTEAPPLVRVGPGAALALPLPRAGARRCRGSSRPSPMRPRPRRPSARRPDLGVADVSKTFQLAGQTIHGLADVDVELRAGETLGLVGESGSGKTTLARVLLGLTAPDAGRRSSSTAARCRRRRGSARASSRRRCRSCSRTPTRR